MYSLSSWYSWSWMFEFSTHNKRRTEDKVFFGGLNNSGKRREEKVESRQQQLELERWTNKPTKVESRHENEQNEGWARLDLQDLVAYFFLSFLFLHLCPHKLPHNTPEPPRCRRHGKFVGNLQLVCYNSWVFLFGKMSTKIIWVPVANSRGKLQVVQLGWWAEANLKL